MNVPHTQNFYQWKVCFSYHEIYFMCIVWSFYVKKKKKKLYNYKLIYKTMSTDLIILIKLFLKVIEIRKMLVIPYFKHVLLFKLTINL